MVETEIPADLKVEVMAVSPYTTRPECVKCGRKVWFLDHLLHMGGRALASTIYCPGNQDSTTTVRNILGQEREAEVECGGVFGEHLHMRCNCCGYRWLMHTKPIRRTGVYTTGPK